MGTHPASPEWLNRPDHSFRPFGATTQCTSSAARRPKVVALLASNQSLLVTFSLKHKIIEMEQQLGVVMRWMIMISSVLVAVAQTLEQNLQ